MCQTAVCDWYAHSGHFLTRVKENPFSGHTYTQECTLFCPLLPIEVSDGGGCPPAQGVGSCYDVRKSGKNTETCYSLWNAMVTANKVSKEASRSLGKCHFAELVKHMNGFR